MDYESMSDDEIRVKLQEAGLPVGPIIESTRKVYIRKLKRLAGELPEVAVQPDNENDEDVVEPQPSPTTRERPKTAKTRSPASAAGDAGDVRQRRTQQKKLNVPITKVVEEPSGGGLCAGLMIKLIIFLVLCVILATVLGLTGQFEPIKLISE